MNKSPEPKVSPSQQKKPKEEKKVDQMMFKPIYEADPKIEEEIKVFNNDAVSDFFNPGNKIFRDEELKRNREELKQQDEYMH